MNKKFVYQVGSNKKVKKKQPLTNLSKFTENKFALTLSDDPYIGTSRWRRTKTQHRCAQYTNNTDVHNTQTTHQTLPLSTDVETAPKTLQARTRLAAFFYSSEGQ